MIDYAAISRQIQDLAPSSTNDYEHVYLDESSEQKKLLNGAPWKLDPEYFKYVKVSSLALCRMSMHARAGKSQEVMGVLTGKIKKNTFVVLDCYPLPVEATETRVNAMGEAYEYMVQYLDSMQEVGRRENIVGWYHSHPGYGCWLSGIDVGTQKQNQAFQDPFLAIVVDPNRTIAGKKVDIGAFRTYPESTRRPGASEAARSKRASSSAAVNEYGLYASDYYPLEISYFRSPLDEPLFELVWSRYWTTLLSQNPLAVNTDETAPEMEELAKLANELAQMPQEMGGLQRPVGAPSQQLRNIARQMSELASADCSKLIANKGRGDIFKLDSN